MHLQTPILILLTAFAVTTTKAQALWDLPSAYPSSNFHTENTIRFAQEVDKASNGALKITVHPDASLLKGPEIKRAVQGGQAQIGEILLSVHQNEWQVFGVDTLPFLSDSYESSLRLYKATRPALEKRLAAQGMLLLYSVPWPPQGVFCKRPLADMRDLKGAKWRTYSPATSRIAELIGAQPVTVQASELTQAMATGVIECQMSSAPTGFDSRAYSYMKHFYDARAWLPKNAVIVNKEAFDALGKPAQEALVKAATDAEARGWALSRTQNEQALTQLRQKGMLVAEPSESLKAGFRKVGAVMLEEWLQKVGPEGRAIIEAYRRPEKP